METSEFDSIGMLRGVSRTFALTIPVLPPGLRDVVGNAYLLCRIADTIEDDKALDREQKRLYSEKFVDLVAGDGDAAGFASELAPLLDAGTPPSERELVASAAEAIAVTRSFKRAQRAALARCVSIMANGMAYYQQRHGDGRGLPDLASFNHYCYCVAGVVGELLTELFCDYDHRIAARRPELMRLATLFGQGLQMTNILKDVHEDNARGACWLPRDVFTAAGYDLNNMQKWEYNTAWRDAMAHMTGLTTWYLRQAVAYSLAIPREHKAVRRFCLWATGMAACTMRKLSAKPDFKSGNEVKISRRVVYGTGLMIQAFASSDSMITAGFSRLMATLPAVTDPNLAIPARPPE